MMTMDQLKPILKTPILKTIAERFVNEIKGEENLEAKINDFYKSINPYGF